MSRAADPTVTYRCRHPGMQHGVCRRTPREFAPTRRQACNQRVAGMEYGIRNTEYEVRRACMCPSGNQIAPLWRPLHVGIGISVSAFKRGRRATGQWPVEWAGRMWVLGSAQGLKD